MIPHIQVRGNAMKAPFVSAIPSRFPSIDADRLAARLGEDTEIALVDVREEGVQARDGHIIFSVPLPLSRLELRAGTLLKRRGVPMVVTDGGPGDLGEQLFDAPLQMLRTIPFCRSSRAPTCSSRPTAFSPPTAFPSAMP
ncbi:MAG: hypothetical protein ABSG20_32750, partial [Bradyrhizobium sp.]